MENQLHDPNPGSQADRLGRRERASCGVGVLMDLSNQKSHRTVRDSLEILRHLDHRGARGAEENTGDGAGILLQKPHEFFKDEVDGLGEDDGYGVAQIFFPKKENLHGPFIDLLEKSAAEEGFEVAAWRVPPTRNHKLGQTALESEPATRQLFVRPAKEDTPPEVLDRKLYILRRVMENTVEAEKPSGWESFYICSLSRRTIVYKGMLTNKQLEIYYPDLADQRVKTSLALVHARFSTNTLGSWKLAHPHRSIAHNGEINTFRGNYSWLRAREADLAHPDFGPDIEKLKPVTTADQSDTAMLDNALELIVESGRPLHHALRMLIPEAWNKDPLISRQKRDWYDYHSTLCEPWDGPALVAFTDGYNVGAVLDRNGFRPCRYSLTKDNRLIMASETGVLDLKPEDVLERGRLKPGQMFLAGAKDQRIIPDEEVFQRLTSHQYGNWLKQNRVKLEDVLQDFSGGEPKPVSDGLHKHQRAFGYTLESLARFIQPMIEDGKDPVGAMGDDAPLALLSNRNKPLFNYFKQLFAQVSNPPIDYIREDFVTSLESHIGRQRNFLDESEEHCRRLYLPSPILRNHELAAIKQIDRNGITACEIDTTFDTEMSLKEAIDQVRAKAVAAIEKGFEILVLSDRNSGPDRIPIPSLLAVSGLRHHLIRSGLLTRAALVVESGQPLSVHHFCTLIGYGADAVNPWLAFESIRPMLNGNPSAWPNAVDKFIAAVEDGLLKVMSKMGISTLESYKGAQIFEALGLETAFVEEYFTGTVTRIGGIGLVEIEEDCRESHRLAYDVSMDLNLPLDAGGDFYWRRDGEFHMWNPQTVGTLQYAVRTGDRDIYKKFSKMANDCHEQIQSLRGLLDFKFDESKRIALSEVEPAEEILKRFSTGSMSFGALSLEVHETLAIAMNRIQGVACSGEGGEQTERFGTERECKNKQVASGRFGVTANYLANATQLEIKMAQGAKPGEGGQLPGEKVDEMIAQVRHTTPGVGLISPPPHHDIYSIEDLAQLIHDLKCANTEAEIFVKLVASTGVGTIAAGVSKARADGIIIAGDSGGTGAAAKTSIKSAGLPWELGLADTQQVLVENRLRSRVRVRVDGGLRTGRDVAIAALLGAEGYGFGTSALVTLGCIMLRKCHCNTCSVGVATQDPRLRKKFPGKPEHLIRYLTWIAEETREIMAALGFQTLDQMVGRVDKLKQRPDLKGRAAKTDLSLILRKPEPKDQRRKIIEQNHKLEGKLDHKLIELASPALERGEKVNLAMEINNRDRTFGTMLSSLVAKKFGEQGLPDNTIEVYLAGSAGQSFGAFLSRGITMHLEGEANDYVGKGLSGGKLTISTPPNAAYKADQNIIIGNVALYGATAGEAYFNGIAGERFAVRNSGAMAVVEGIGNHGCEYMTGGIVVSLGNVGRNFAAGMSGGEAYVLHEDDGVILEDAVNPAMIQSESVTATRDQEIVKRLIENHFHQTGSQKARALLDDWEASIRKFTKIIPVAYAEVIEKNMRRGTDIQVSMPSWTSPRMTYAHLTRGSRYE